MKGLLVAAMAAAMLAAPTTGRAQGEHADSVDAGQTAPNRIVAVRQGGTLVRLADGTEWRVYLSDRPTADAWKRGDQIRVAYLPVVVGATGSYRYKLVNDTAGSTVAAQFLGHVPDVN